MAKRLLLLLALSIPLLVPGLVMTGAAGGSLGDQKAALDAKLANVKSKISAQQAKASRLQAQIGSLTGQIKTLQARVGDVSQQLSALQTDLELHQRRLHKLNELYRLQTIHFNYLKREYSLAF